MRKDGFIENFGLFASLVVSMIGGGIFYDPAIMSNYVGQNGWIVAIAGGIILYLIILLIKKLNDLNGYKMLTSIFNNNYGIFLGKVLSLSYSIAVIIVLAISLRLFGEVISIYLLSNTPIQVILITMIFMGAYLSRGGLANVVHFNEIVFWIMFIPIGIILILTLPEADFSNILPVFSGYSLKNYVAAIFEMIFMLNGFTMAFTLIPYARHKGNINKIAARASIFITIFYAIIFIMVCAVLSTNQVSDSIFPTITMLQSINSRNAILEKWDTLIMSLWVIFYFTSFANLYYFASITLKKVIGIHDIRTSSMIYVPVVYIAAIMPRNVINIINLRFSTLRIIYVCTIVGVTAVTLGISFLRRRSINEK